MEYIPEQLIMLSCTLKVNDPRGKSAAQSTLAKKKRDHGDKDQGKNGSTNQDGDPLTISPRALAAEREELIALREQVEDLRRKLVEKDELLRLAEISKVQMDSVHAKLDELRHRVAEKDALIRSTQCQLSDAKVPFLYALCCFSELKLFLLYHGCSISFILTSKISLDSWNCFGIISLIYINSYL